MATANNPLRDISDITEPVAKKALNELKEKPEEIDANLKSLSRWLSTVKHFSCPSTKEFLIPFLRQAKYEHAKAQLRLDNYCTMHSSTKYGRTEWFNPLKSDDPAFIEYQRQKIHIPLGYIGEDGPFVLLIKFGNYDMEKLSQEDLWRAIIMQTEWLCWLPKLQVVGISILIDMTGISAKTLLTFQNPKDQSDGMKYWQESMPCRTKHLIYYNEPPIFDAFFKVAEQFMTAKIRSRVIRCKSNIDVACDRLPGLKDILPKEYGGNGKSVDELYDIRMNEMKDYWRNGVVWQVSVNEERRPDKSKLDKSDQIKSLEGTYIKIDERF